MAASKSVTSKQSARRATPASIKVATPSAPVAFNESTRDKILAEILTSWAKNPHQDSSFTSQESYRIAKKFHVTNMQVAGVRSALAKGSYGATMKTLVTRRRKELGLTTGLKAATVR